MHGAHQSGPIDVEARKERVRVHLSGFAIRFVKHCLLALAEYGWLAGFCECGNAIGVDVGLGEVEKSESVEKNPQRLV